MWGARASGSAHPNWSVRTSNALTFSLSLALDPPNSVDGKTNIEIDRQTIPVTSQNCETHGEVWFKKEKGIWMVR